MDQHNVELNNIKTTTILPLNTSLTLSEVQKLQERFKLAYIFEKTPSEIDLRLQSQYSSDLDLAKMDITTISITNENVDSAIELFIRVFNEKNPSMLSEVELNLIQLKLKDFLLGASQYSIIYLFHEQPVALIGFWPGLLHPLLKSTVNHVGVVGYDSHILSKSQANAIKLHWKQVINKAQILTKDSTIKTTARIDLFNLPSQRLFTQFGFSPVSLELTPK